MRIEDEIKQKAFKDPYNKVVVNLLYTHSYFVTKQSALFKPYGLSPEQYNVMRILRGQQGKPITVSSIQDRMLNKMSNASRLVEKLKQKGYVVREECPSDRRQVDIVITESGLDILNQLEESVYAFNKTVVNLSEEETIQLNELLDKFRG
ncbi:MarR family winged helix-turn-helix transcriptional regulator [Belliella kenyensis]|uniref:MarR family winged helix-turn-helix transcriptional regulator n=1 Tax=Belliella kenyensis TaxID=1472724 RepID=A0ABV8EN68_9BACT|nr:MarR family transcriptional regulator [Belliella kenyensis]MCH7400599.1 MarR family transcriptional regulator [Belliella kenyensis]MDN3602114.1 MarR family transcriptional regulator [Belliella kenyensis]